MHKKQLLLIIISQFLNLLNINAQGVLCSWLSDPMVKNGQQTLFMRTYIAQQEITNASLTIASKGPYRLFVNGRAVYTSYVYGEALKPESDCETLYLDVTDYMRADSNTIAVWYAPNVDNRNFSYSEVQPMVAVNFYGIENNGAEFSYISDSTWICKNANGYSDINIENENALEYVEGWNLGEPNDQMLWRHSQVVKSNWETIMKSYQRQVFSDYSLKVILPNYFDVADDKNVISYDFDKGFWGTVRVTIRGANVGKKIYFNGSEYVCNGQLDEQYIGRFVHYGMRKLHITGDFFFQTNQIVKVEGLEIVKNNTAFIKRIRE